MYIDGIEQRNRKGGNMKFLIQHKERFALAIAVVVINAINLGQAIKDGVLTQETIVAFLVAIFTLLGLYYNIPTSEENSYHTQLMQLEKANEDLPDDYFEDDEDEGEDLTYEEEATEDIDDGPNDGGEEDGELDS